MIKILFSIPLFLWACNSRDFSLKESETGIYIEQFSIDNTNENRYTDDNMIYQTYSEYLFEFIHVKSYDSLVYSTSLLQNSWEFQDYESGNDSVIKFVKMKIMFGFDWMEVISDYDQSVIKYTYLNKDLDSLDIEETGLIENRKNIWMHPPRSKYFQILELNPFPYVQMPLKIGKEWKWSLNIGSQWGDYRWKEWKGNVFNTYNYKITDTITINTQLGNLKTYKIKSHANSKIGRTELEAYFNPIYGFVKLNYLNIDSSKTILELIEFKNNLTN